MACLRRIVFEVRFNNYKHVFERNIIVFLFYMQCDCGKCTKNAVIFIRRSRKTYKSALDFFPKLCYNEISINI